MEEALMWIFFLVIGLFALFFVTKTVFNWLRIFFGASINFIRMLLIATGVVGTVALVTYPDDTIAFFYQIWGCLIEFRDWMTDSRSAFKG